MSDYDLLDFSCSYNDWIKPEAAPSLLTHSRRGRRVWFPEEEDELAEVVCEVDSRSELTEEDRDALFFCNDEYVSLKSDARLMSSGCERSGCSKHLDGVFDEKSKEAQAKLNKWVEDGQEQRGLERMANTEMGDLRQQEQFRVIMDVLRAQDDMIIEKGEVDAEALRKVSCKATKVARHFARMMAKADARSVGRSDFGCSSHPEGKSGSRPSKPKSHSSSASKRLSSSKKGISSTGDREHNHHRGHSEKKVKEETTKKQKMGRIEKFNQKFKEKKAGIMSRIPRIA
jgi:hypothetical protein